MITGRVAQVSMAQEHWNEALLTLPRPHVLQSREWGQVKAVTGWRPSHLLLTQGDAVRAAALVLSREVPLLRVPMLYVPKGPLLAVEDDAALLEQALALLEREAGRRRAIFVKVDPDLAAGNRTALEVLRRRGWRRAAEVQFRNTVHVDLRPDEPDLLAAMKPKTRYNIRLAERRGVQVRVGGEADLPAFYHLFRETGARDRFLIRPYGYYRTVWQTFLDAGLGRIFLAEHAGEVLAGLIVLRFGPTAWYMYGASSDRKREHMPNYLLQWAAMRWAKSVGCTTYDMWGAPERLEASDPLWGVYRFKEGFGGRLVEHIGAYDFVVRPALYLLFTWAVPRILALWRWARRQPTLGQAGPG